MDKAKPFSIPKREVWEAFKRVKANQGAAGVDGQSVAAFEADLSNNLYKLWNRLSSGSYFPPPVRQVAIPKRDGGGERMLGIPTVSDRIAQEVARRYLEPVFHTDSYGYRPGKSAIAAVATARQRCWRHDWVLDLDIRAFFDSLDWELMLAAGRDLSLPERGGGAGPEAGDLCAAGGMEAGAASGEDAYRLLQGCEPARRPPRHPLRFSGLSVSRPENQVGGERQRGLCTQFPAGGQSEGADAHQPGDPEMGAAPSQRQIPGRSGPDVQCDYPWLDRLLQSLLSDAVTSDAQEDRCLCHQMGPPQVQADGAPDQGRERLVRPATPEDTASLRALATLLWQRLSIGSRVNSRGSCTVLGAPGGESPPGDSTSST